MFYGQYSVRGITMIGGDSGGPVYVDHGGGQVGAAGVISASNYAKGDECPIPGALGHRDGQHLHRCRSRRMNSNTILVSKTLHLSSVTLIAGLLLVTGGCSDTSGSERASKKSPQRKTQQDETAQTKITTSSSDPRSVSTIVPWSLAKRDGKRLVIDTASAPTCAYNFGYSVYENERAVRITTYTIRPRTEPASHACGETMPVDHAAQFTITLNKPLGTRQLIGITPPGYRRAAG
jgi:hypothetical protein